MKNRFTVKRMTIDALMLALMCIIGMFSIPLGANIKISLQLLMVYIICLTLPNVLDCLFIMVLYLLLGLFLPIYAGFNAGISPTFGYVIGFVSISGPISLISKNKKLNEITRLIIASVVGLLILYVVGTIFIMLYLKMTLDKALIVSVLPYIPFDIFKIILAITLYKLLPKRILE